MSSRVIALRSCCRPASILLRVFWCPLSIYPPALSQIEEHMQRQAGILRNTGARILLTVPQAVIVGSLLRGLVETLEAVETVARLSNAPATALPPVPSSMAPMAARRPVRSAKRQAVSSPADVREAVSSAQSGGRKSVLMRVKSAQGMRFVAVPIGNA
jgi:hypothetical protein